MASRPEPDVRPARAADAGPVARIYNHYVRETVVTFEEEPVSATDMAARIQAVQDAGLPWLVADADGSVLGYAYAARWRARSAYRFTVEAAVYLEQWQYGRGVGSALYGELLAVLQAGGVHAVIGGIALPNDASIRLHEKFGFHKVAHFHEVGFKRNRWVDVGYWQKILQSA